MGPTSAEINKVIQNVKIIKIMKSCGYRDADIAKYVNLSIKTFLNVIEGDEYLRDVYKNAQEILASDIEKKFIENMLASMENGDNTDAKWMMERTNPKYAKKDTIDLHVRSIDEVILEKDKGNGEDGKQ